MQHRHGFSLLEIIVACSIAGAIALSMTVVWFKNQEKRNFAQACTLVEQTLDRCFHVAWDTGQEVSVQLAIHNNALTMAIVPWMASGAMPTVSRTKKWSLHDISLAPNYAHMMQKLLASHKDVSAIQSFSVSIDTTPEIRFVGHIGLIGASDTTEPVLILRKNQLSHTINLRAYTAPKTFLSIPPLDPRI